MNPPPVVLREEVDMRLLSNLSANFSSAREAIFELVDNALASRIPVEPVTVTITGAGWSTPGGHLKIISKGGRGMDPEGLQQFLKWGKRPEETGLNRYGQGGKAAIGYLGTGVRIRANGAGDTQAYEFHDPDWLARPEGVEKEYVAKPVDATVPGVGVVEIEITGLKKTINAKKLRHDLAMTYRPALAGGDLTLKVRGKRVAPAPLPAEPRSEFDHSLVVQTPENPEGQTVRLRGWVGVAPPKFEGKGGLRCSAYGRVIVAREYFGHRDANFKASLNSLVGEVDLSFVPPTLNKTEFDEESPAWQAAKKAVYREMDPYVKSLLAKKELSEPSEEERLRAMEAKDIARRALERIAEEAARRGHAGSKRGRKPPSPKGGFNQPPNPESGPGQQQEPRTPPPAGAVGKLQRKGMSLDWDVRALDPKIRSATPDENGHAEIVINNRYPLYKQRNGDLPYMLETGLLEQLKPGGGDDKSVAEYHEQVAEALYYALAETKS